MQRKRPTVRATVGVFVVAIASIAGLSLVRSRHANDDSGRTDGRIDSPTTRVSQRPNAKPLYITTFGGTGTDEFGAVTADGSGAVYTVGGLMGIPDFDTRPEVAVMYTAGFGNTDCFVSKLDADGALAWVRGFRTLDNSGYCTANSVGLDASGNVYTSGRFSGSVDFDPGPHTKTLTLDGSFIVKLDLSGNLIWARDLPVTLARGSLHVNSAGETLTVGTFVGLTNFGSGSRSTYLTGSATGDAFLLQLDASGGVGWVKQFGSLDVSSKIDHPLIGVDSLGNVTLAGSFAGRIDVDPSEGAKVLTAPTTQHREGPEDLSIFEPDHDVFILKMDRYGHLSWTATFGGRGDDVVMSLAVGGDGASFLSGSFSGSVDVDPGKGKATLKSKGHEDAYLMHLDPAGSFEWAKSYGGRYRDAAVSIVVDSAGTTYATGIFQGTVDFDAALGTGTVTSYSDPTGGDSEAFDADAFMVKLDRSGTLIWARQFGSGNGTCQGEAIALDRNGNLITAGTFGGVVDFDPGNETANRRSNGRMDVFVSKITSAGFALVRSGSPSTTATVVPSATKTTGPVTVSILNTASVSRTRVDRAGNVYITGEFFGSSDFDPGPGTARLTATGESDTFVVKYNPTGALSWARQFVNSRYDESNEGKSVDVDGSGNVYVGGVFEGTVDFDPGLASTRLTVAHPSKDPFEPDSEPYVVKLTPSGDFAWARHFSSTEAFITLDDIGVDAKGDAYATGQFEGTINFDPMNITSASPDTADHYLVKLDPYGAAQWAISRNPVGNSTDRIAVTPTGHVRLVHDLAPLVTFAVDDVDPSGKTVWAKEFRGAGVVTALENDDSGDVYIIGAFSESLVIGTRETSTLRATRPPPDSDSFVVKLSPTGDQLWAKSLRLEDSFVFDSPAAGVDGVGNVYLTGEFRGTIDVDPGPSVVTLTQSDTTAAQSSDMYVVKLDGLGAFQWARQFGEAPAGPKDDADMQSSMNGARAQGTSIVADEKEVVTLTGEFSGRVDFDPSPGTAVQDSSRSSTFVIRLDRNGELVRSVGP